MQRTNIIMQSPCHNYFVVLQSNVASVANSTGLRRTKKSTQAVYFPSCEPCAILFTTLCKIKNHFPNYKPLSTVTLNTLTCQCKRRLQVTPFAVSHYHSYA